MNMDELETLMEIQGYREANLLGSHCSGRTRQGLWNKQGDAAALVGADSKIDDGGGAGVSSGHEEEEEKKGEKMKVPVGCIYNKAGR